MNNSVSGDTYFYLPIAVQCLSTSYVISYQKLFTSVMKLDIAELTGIDANSAIRIPLLICFARKLTLWLVQYLPLTPLSFSFPDILFLLLPFYTPVLLIFFTYSISCTFQKINRSKTVTHLYRYFLSIQIKENSVSKKYR